MNIAYIKEIDMLTNLEISKIFEPGLKFSSHIGK